VKPQQNQALTELATYPQVIHNLLLLAIDTVIHRLSTT